jgi:AraC-like DNA-binding protein
LSSTLSVVTEPSVTPDLYFYPVTQPIEIVPGVIFYSYFASMRKEKACFFEHNTLVLQVSGQFTIETATETVSMTKGEMILIRKNQLAQLIKKPVEDKEYRTIVILLREELLRKMALEEKIDTVQKYSGAPNIHIPDNDFLRGFFQSIVPYVQNTADKIPPALGMLKVKEAVQLLLQAVPATKDFLFDFSEPHKIDLEKFMHSNFYFNVPVEKFAQLTGRSLAGFKRDFQKTFGTPPRQWLQEKRLSEARHLIENKHKKSSSIYLDLGFESLSHFSHSFKKKYGKSPTEW